MARMRYIKPEFWTDSRMVRLSRDARLFYIGTWNFAICEKGHLEDDPIRLKMQIFPADNVDVSALLGELVDSGRLVRLTAPDGTSYLRITHLEVHQKVDGRWTPRCPACKTSADLTETLPSLGEALTSKNTAEQPSLALVAENHTETLPNSPQEGRGGEGRGGITTLSNAARRTPVADPDFDAFWETYPRREGKKTARTAWVKARREATAAQILIGAKRHANDPNRDPSFTKLPATWLNAGGWDDEPLPAREASTGSKRTTPSAPGYEWAGR